MIFICYLYSNTVEVHENTRKDALKLNQGISLYWGFMMKKYHDKEITERVTGMNG